jgi:nucleotide-binding universal stress UspA family protein
MSFTPLESGLASYPTGTGFVGFPVEDLASRRQAAEKTFRAFAERRSIAWETPSGPADHPTAHWLARVGAGDRPTGELARLYDLTVLGRPGDNALSPPIALLEAVLFDSGRPILVTPPRAPAQLGRRTLIAWNGSTESARAVAFARPFLARAEQIVVLTVEGGSVSGPEAEDVAAALRRDGIAAAAMRVGEDGRSAGEAILATAAEQGTDLLIKGAYTNSRLRQMIFGGATSHILRKADLPVLMSH